MISIRSDLGNYLIGAIIILSGLFMLILPSFLLTAGADGPPPPPASVLFGIGAIFGFPLMATGAILTQKRYRFTLYLATFTGITYIAAPLALTGSLFIPLYIPAAIVFMTMVIPGWTYIAIVRLTRI
jgi:hypothetical protein